MTSFDIALTKPSDHDFYRSGVKEPHRGITKVLLQKYPELRQYLGQRNPWSFAIGVLAVGGHLAVAWAVSGYPWWVAILTAFFVGTIFSISFGALVHERLGIWVYERRGWIGTRDRRAPTGREAAPTSR